MLGESADVPSYESSKNVDTTFLTAYHNHTMYHIHRHEYSSHMHLYHMHHADAESMPVYVLRTTSTLEVSLPLVMQY